MSKKNEIKNDTEKAKEKQSLNLETNFPVGTKKPKTR